MTQAMLTMLMTTVNAPYQNQLDAEGLAGALKEGEIDLGQVSSFFTETSVEAQKAFAEEYNISSETLVSVATAFQGWSGQPVGLIG